jgi:hypothetical protein
MLRASTASAAAGRALPAKIRYTACRDQLASNARSRRESRTNRELIKRYLERMTAPDAGLRDIVREAATLLSPVVAVVERCRTEPNPRQDLARACGAVISSFGLLRERLWSMPASPMVTRVDTMLYVEQRIVDEAARLAFRPHTDQWSKAARAFGDGLTGSSDELLLLAARL